MIRWVPTSLIIFLITVTTACGTGPALREKTDSDVSVNVAAGAVDIDVNSGFTLEFSVAASASTINASTFFVVPIIDSSTSISPQNVALKSTIDTTVCNPDNALSGTITPSTSAACDTRYTLNPDSPLGYETEYALCITSGVSFCDSNINGFFAGLMEIFTTVEDGPAYTVGGTISGLSGTVVLQNNAGDDLTLSENGEFTFSTAVTDIAAYDVTVLTNPDGQVCTASNNSGNISGANITDVVVTCSDDAYTLGGTVSGLSGTLVLWNNEADDLIIESNGDFTFDTPVADGAAYDVTVKTNPDGQTCDVLNDSGTIDGAKVTNVTVTCTTNAYTLGGTVLGLDTDNDMEITLHEDGGADVAVDENGEFHFDTQYDDGYEYTVTITGQPNGQTCHIRNSSGEGTIDGANVDTIDVYCAYFAYVTNKTDDTVSVIDTTNNTGFGDVIPVGEGPDALAIKPDGSKVYVTNSDSDSVSVIDTATNTVVYTIDSGFANPRGIDVSPDGTQIYVSNHDSNYVCVYDVTGDPVKVGDNIVLAYGLPLGLAFKPPNGDKVYVATYHGPPVAQYASVIDTATRNLSYINLQNNAAPSDVDFTPDGSLAYITRPWRDSVAKVDTTSQTVMLPVDQIPTDTWPGTLAITPDGAEVYVSNNGYISVISVSGNNIIDTIIGFSGPSGIDFNHDGDIAYISNSGSNTVSMVDTTTREITGDPITVGNGPIGIAVQKPNIPYIP
jgi:YVTN family beta-propeller protein